MQDILEKAQTFLYENGYKVRLSLDLLTGDHERFEEDDALWIKGDVKPEGYFTFTVGDFRDVLPKISFHPGKRSRYSNEEWEKHKAQWEEDKRKALIRKKEGHERAEKDARYIWDNANPRSSGGAGEYCQRKRIAGVVSRYTTEGGREVDIIPMYRMGEGGAFLFRGVQKILPDGTKLFIKGQEVEGTFCPIIEYAPSDSYDYAIAEGYATSETVARLSRCKTFAAFHAGNLLHVGNALRTAFSIKRLFIFADNDHRTEKKHGKNTGIEAAKECAEELGAKIIWPTFTAEEEWASDWNDYFLIHGEEATAQEIKRQMDAQSDLADVPAISGSYRSLGKAGGLEGDEAAPGATEEKAKVKKRLLATKIINEDDEEGKSLLKESILDLMNSASADTDLKKKAKALLVKLTKLKGAPYQLAQEFLTDAGFIDEEERILLKYYRYDFYRFKKTHYQKLDDEWVKGSINRWLIDGKHPTLAGTDMVGKILSVLKVKPVYVGEQIALPAKLTDDGSKFGEWQTARNIVPLKNGLFDTETEKVIPESPEFFFDYALPFDYVKDAKCPTYEKICADIFSSPEEILVWEEIMGLHIYNPFLVEKMFLLSGAGANGKSVMTTILTCLLGAKNVSAVPIECFSPNSFSFIETLGKLANIIPDMKDIEGIDEGALKAFISREPMHFNRKNKPVVKARPTAFLTACTNTKPRFSDKTDGVWRRMLLLEFKKQIPVEDRDPRYRDPKFWEDSGELPGIFNKALAGAKRVEKRGSILETDDIKEAVEEYRQEQNYAAGFAREFLEFGESFRSPSHPIYMAFKNMVRDAGGRTSASKTFFSQLKAEAKIMGHEIEITKKTERGAGDYIGKFLVGARLNEFGELLSVRGEDTSF